MNFLREDYRTDSKELILDGKNFQFINMEGQYLRQSRWKSKDQEKS
jgi:hypothetical protein